MLCHRRLSKRRLPNALDNYESIVKARNIGLIEQSHGNASGDPDRRIPAILRGVEHANPSAIVKADPDG
jgi:hypothetical protein